MKTFITSFIIMFSLTTLVMASFQTATYVYTTPEVGISCLKVNPMLGGEPVAIGCYQGDVQKPGSCMDKAMTLKYQPDATIINFHGLCE